MKPLPGTLTLVLLTGLLTASCGVSVNRSIQLPDGTTHQGSVSTVNGKVTIGTGCTVQGNCQTVNGSIRVGAKSKVGKLNTVNGSIRIGPEVTVNGDAVTVNGRIQSGSGTHVDGSLATVNGDVRLENTEVTRDIKTVNGEISLSKGSKVRGNIILEGRSGPLSRRKPLVVTLSDASVVEGDIINRDTDVTAQVVLDADSKVLGVLKNAHVIQADEE